jgi:hypothetical protein
MKNQPRMSRWIRMSLSVWCFVLPALVFTDINEEIGFSKQVLQNGGIADSAARISGAKC